MSSGLSIAVDRPGQETSEGAHVVVVDGGDLEGRYHRLLELVMRMGDWLTSPQAQLLQPEVWEEQFERYRERLEELRALGSELRPASLRPRREALSGELLAVEILELFAA